MNELIIPNKLYGRDREVMLDSLGVKFGLKVKLGWAARFYYIAAMNFVLPFRQCYVGFNNLRSLSLSYENKTPLVLKTKSITYGSYFR